MPKSEINKEGSKCDFLSSCKPKRILRAVSVLRQMNNKFYETSKKKPLFDGIEEKPVFLHVTMKKIPSKLMQKFIRVRLPKSLFTEKTEVCLITGDLDKRNTKAEVEPDIMHFKEVLKKEGISSINEVITLRQLRKEYKAYEAKRQLAGAYDTFLCDKKIAGVLPNALGKNFFRKRKLPIQINMNTPNLKKQVDSALTSTVFYITCKGNSCTAEVAHLSMDNEDIVKNISSSIDALKEQLPGGCDNILSLYLKTEKSKAIPLYMSFDNPNEVSLKVKRKKADVVAEELSTMPDTEVQVFPDGKIIVKKPGAKEKTNKKSVSRKSLKKTKKMRIDKKE